MKRSNSNGASYNGGHVRSMSGSRQSLAMGRPSQSQLGRPSSGAILNEIGQASAKRTSIRPPGNFTPAAARTAAATTDTERRSSVYRPRPSTNGPVHHQSFFQATPQAAGVPRDPRPLRDRQFQARIGQELIEYMSRNNFELEMKHSLSQNVMKSPTQKDFNFMFQWLYHRIDPNHRFQKNIDQEVPPILKQMRYPYEKNITKSQIAAVGGQNWSTFLGLLHWMMQLSQMLDGYATGQYDYACEEDNIDISGDRIMFNFLSNAYRDWLAMDEDMNDEDAERVLAPHVAAMAEEFDEANSKHTEQLDMLEAENEGLRQQIKEIQAATPNPVELDEHCKIMEEDKVKFEDWNDKISQRIEKYEGRTRVLEEEIEKLNDEIKEADEERRALQKSVDAQGISMQDIDRMNSERERLQKGIESASIKLEEVKKKVAEREADASEKLEELEQTVDRYNTLCYQTALIPSSAANAKGRDYELQIMISDDSDLTSTNFKTSMNPSSAGRLLEDSNTGYQPGHILNLDLRGQLRSNLLALRKEISERRNIAVEDMMKDHELLEGIKEAIEDKRSEVDALQHRVRAAEEEYEKTKEVTQAQKMASDTQIEKMEKELSRMRAGLSDSVQVLEQREINTTIEYEQLVLRASSLREELHTEIDRMLNDVIKFKIHIQKSLGDYEGFVDDELQAELGPDENLVGSSELPREYDE